MFRSVPTIRERVASSATVYSDEPASWDELHAACTNQAESFFSRLRRAEIRQHHRISGRYLAAYAKKMACREDHRRRPNGTLFLLTAAAAAHPVSRMWKGYWQR